jgi:hypothetical protein
MPRSLADDFLAPVVSLDRVRRALARLDALATRADLTTVHARGRCSRWITGDRMSPRRPIGAEAMKGRAFVRMDDALLARLDAFADEISRRVPGMAVTRADAVRVLLLEGLARHEAERAAAEAPARALAPAPAAPAPPARPAAPVASARGRRRKDAVTDLVLDALAQARDGKSGLSSVVQAVALLEGRGVAIETSHAALLDLARNGKVELRPEGGMRVLTAEQRDRCPAGPDGIVFSWARVLR